MPAPDDRRSLAAERRARTRRIAVAVIALSLGGQCAHWLCFAARWQHPGSRWQKYEHRRLHAAGPFKRWREDLGEEQDSISGASGEPASKPAASGERATSVCRRLPAPWQHRPDEQHRARQPHEKPEYAHEPPTLGYSVLRQAPNGLIPLITTMNTPCLHFEFNEAWLITNAPPSRRLPPLAAGAPPGRHLRVDAVLAERPQKVRIGLARFDGKPPPKFRLAPGAAMS